LRIGEDIGSLGRNVLRHALQIFNPIVSQKVLESVYYVYEASLTLGLYYHLLIAS
jgi:hypothetical protein